MTDKLMVTVNGDCTGNNEHTTTIKRHDGQEMRFYCDGWDGIPYSKVAELLEFLEIEYFTVHKE